MVGFITGPSLEPKGGMLLSMSAAEADLKPQFVFFQIVFPALPTENLDIDDRQDF